MDRREMLKVGATLAAGAVAQAVRAQAPAAAAPPAPVQPVGTNGFAVSVWSGNLQWLRTPADLAKGVRDLGLTRIDLAVMPAPGHVDPARVATELPAFVDGLRQGGVTVTCLSTGIADADTPGADALLRAAAAAGITHYAWGGLRYDEAAPYAAQLDAMRARVQRLARLNQRYKVKGLYLPTRGAGQVGAGFYDILELMRGLDPRWTGIFYDSGALLQATPDLMVAQLRAAGPHIGGVVVTDAAVTLDLPEWRQGPYEGSADQLAGAYTGGDFTGGPGDPLALGGGGRPLPFHYRPVRTGTGMVDLEQLSRTLKQINFAGPAEVRARFPLYGAETGAAAITGDRLTVLGEIKRERILVEHAFHRDWDLKVALPTFLQPGRTGPVTPGGE